MALVAAARGRSREAGIGIAVSVLAVAAMAVDHLLGDDPGLEDPGAFLLASALSLALAWLLFARVVPRVRDDPGRATTYALAFSILAALGVFALLWLGLPFVLAGAGVALGLVGRSGNRRAVATAAVVLGAAVLLLGVGYYVVDAIEST
ncbi:MAG TPA: hypothetical protein VK874_08410 [Gaiellaceae bacterium]|nr:hypothetical protein [Gaiellaceae bacterium]